MRRCNAVLIGVLVITTAVPSLAATVTEGTNTTGIDYGPAGVDSDFELKHDQGRKVHRILPSGEAIDYRGGDTVSETYGDYQAPVTVQAAPGIGLSTGTSIATSTNASLWDGVTWGLGNPLYLATITHTAVATDSSTSTYTEYGLGINYTPVSAELVLQMPTVLNGNTQAFCVRSTGLNAYDYCWYPSSAGSFVLLRPGLRLASFSGINGRMAFGNLTTDDTVDGLLQIEPLATPNTAKGAVYVGKTWAQGPTLSAFETLLSVNGEVFLGDISPGVGRLRLGANANQGFFSWNTYYNGSASVAMDTGKPAWNTNMTGGGGTDSFAIQRASASAGTLSFKTLAQVVPQATGWGRLILSAGLNGDGLRLSKSGASGGGTGGLCMSFDDSGNYPSCIRSYESGDATTSYVAYTVNTGVSTQLEIARMWASGYLEIQPGLALRLLGGTSGSVSHAAAATGGNVRVIEPTTTPSPGQAYVVSATATSAGTNTVTLTWQNVNTVTSTVTSSLVLQKQAISSGVTTATASATASDLGAMATPMMFICPANSHCAGKTDATTSTSTATGTGTFYWTNNQPVSWTNTNTTTDTSSGLTTSSVVDLVTGLNNGRVTGVQAFDPSSKGATGTCSGGQYVNAIGASSVTCGTPSSGVSGTGNAGRTTIWDGTSSIANGNWYDSTSLLPVTDAFQDIGATSPYRVKNIYQSGTLYNGSGTVANGHASADCQSDGTNCPGIAILGLGFGYGYNSGSLVTDTSGTWLDAIPLTISFASGDKLLAMGTVSLTSSGTGSSTNCYARIQYDGSTLGPEFVYEASTSSIPVNLKPLAVLEGISAGSHTITMQIQSTVGYNCTVQATRAYFVVQTVH